MGFGTSATHIIFFISAVVIATTIVGALHGTAGQLSGGIGTKSESLHKELTTDLRIVNDPAEVQTNPLVVYVLNTGSRAMDPELIVLLVNGQVESISDLTVIDGGPMWYPGEILQITGPSIGGGDHRVRVITDSGASDTLRFSG
jgi:archaeal flagellar protein FlaG